MASTEHPNLLVVFFSRTGKTRMLAEAIARATEAEVEELRESKSRLGLLGWIRCGYEGTYRRSVQPLPLQHDLRAYDLVFIGSPTWNKALASPVRGFLEANREALTNVALFATCAGQGADAVIEQMKSLLRRTPLATLSMMARDVKRGCAVEVGELTEKALCGLEQQADAQFTEQLNVVGLQSSEAQSRPSRHSTQRPVS